MNSLIFFKAAFAYHLPQTADTNDSDLSTEKFTEGDLRVAEGEKDDEIKNLTFITEKTTEKTDENTTSLEERRKQMRRRKLILKKEIFEKLIKERNDEDKLKAKVSAILITVRVNSRNE